MVTRSLVVALLTGVSRLAAGQQQPPTIPGDLAVALLDHGESQSGNRTPRIVVGRRPLAISIAGASHQFSVLSMSQW